MAKPAATAASTALPPFFSTLTPTSAAIDSMATTIPWRARTGCLACRGATLAFHLFGSGYAGLGA
jgi:hypothetical protein